MRILSLAFRKLNKIKDEAKDAEKDLIFIGFLLLNNPLKPNTPTPKQYYQHTD